MGPMTIRKLLPYSQKFDPGFISLLKKQVLVRSCIITILIICSLPGVTAWSSPVLTDSLPEPLVISRINDQIKFENYSSRDGLTQNSCFSIAQDSDGFMWFGTQDGLNRFDGNEFKVYYPASGIGEKFTSNHIWTLQYREESDELWVGTYGGLCIYLPGADTIRAIGDIYPFAAALNSMAIRKIVSGQSGHMWVITTNNGLIDVDIPGQKLKRYFNTSEYAGQVMDFVVLGERLIAGLKNQLFMASTDSDIVEFQPVGEIVYPSPINAIYGHDERLFIGTLSSGVYVCENLEEGRIHQVLGNLNFGGVDCFGMEGEDYLWIGTRGNGIIRYNIQTQTYQISRYNRYEPYSIGSDFVLDLFLDQQNIMWCGLSGGGISKFDPLMFQFYNLANEPMAPVSLPENMIYSIHQDGNGHYYAGGQNKGLMSWNPENDKVEHYLVSEVEGAPENKIFDIEESENEKLWIASWGGLFEFDKNTGTFENCSDPEFPQSRGLLSVHRLSHDGLFVSGDYGPAIFDPSTRQWSVAELDFLGDFHFISRYIYEDQSGVLWICSERKSLVRLDLTGRQVKAIEKVGKISKTTRHLLPSGDVFWIATDQGIVVYDMIRDQVLQHITLEEIGPSNVVYSIQQDSKGFFWAGTNLGLVRIDPHEFSLQLYNLDNGLEFLEYNTACTVEGIDGTLAFGGVGGITFFHPDYIRTNRYSPSPIITSVSVWDSHAGLWKDGSNKLNYDQNILTFQYTNNNFSNQRRDQFMNRLIGLDANWYHNKNNYAVTYNSLPPGTYTFQVKSANSDGIWAEQPAAFSFSIVPPWWKSWWFLTMVGLAVVTLSVIFMKWRIRNIHQKAELNNRIVETKMMALRAQMNPHFIFNCLNSIDAFIQNNDKYYATTYLNKFARLLRNVLDSSAQNSVKFSRDMETLQLYIELEELRNDHKFSTIFEVDEILLNDDFKVPPLLIQPYVENAIIHGLKNRIGDGGCLLIKAVKMPEYIHYTIEDNGVGRESVPAGRARNKNSYGMQMSSDRIRYFNEEEFPQVTITDLTRNGHPTGTRVEVFLKLK